MGCSPTSLVFLYAFHVATRKPQLTLFIPGIGTLNPKMRTSVLILTQLRTTGLKTLSPRTAMRRSATAARAKAAKKQRQALLLESRPELRSNYVELADGGLFLSAVLVQPLPPGGTGQDGAVLRGAAVRLRGRSARRVPVFVRNGQAALVYPGALRGHVVGAQPDLLVRPDALADVVSEPLVLVAGCGSTEDAAQVVAVLAGSVVALPGGVGQVALAIDLCAFQTNWRKNIWSYAGLVF